MLRYTTDRARPGLVAFYDMRPGNGAGLFLQPRNQHEAPEPKSRLIISPSVSKHVVQSWQTGRNINSDSLYQRARVLCCRHCWLFAEFRRPRVVHRQPAVCLIHFVRRRRRCEGDVCSDQWHHHYSHFSINWKSFSSDAHSRTDHQLTDQSNFLFPFQFVGLGDFQFQFWLTEITWPPSNKVPTLFWTKVLGLFKYFQGLLIILKTTGW